MLFLIHLWFIHPVSTGPFAICRSEYVRRIHWSTTLTVIQAGKVVLVSVALAYWLVSRCTEPLRWSYIVEEIKASGKVFADLSEDQDTNPV